MNGANDFDKRCYDILSRVPDGKVTTYRQIARALNTKAWRAVGSAMARNKRLIVIPCRRVVRSDGSIGQYALGSASKEALLTKEGVVVTNGRVKELDKYLCRF